MSKDISQFQCSSASRKFLNLDVYRASTKQTTVSVLFSEPKIPQLSGPQRRSEHSETFQCSSASRKFLNHGSVELSTTHLRGFSALQRAENSSIEGEAAESRQPVCEFQCSSASRKFLNLLSALDLSDNLKRGFSALQRAENSSIKRCSAASVSSGRSFSALQRAENSSIAHAVGV